MVEHDPATFHLGDEPRPWIDVTTLGDLLDRQAQLTPDRDALVLPDRRTTFAEMADLADQYARALLGWGIDAGDTVGILMPAMPELVAALFGAAKIGAVPVVINARFKAFELGHVVTQGDMALVLTSTSVAEHVDFPALLTEAFPPGGSAEATRLRHLVLVDDAARPGFLGRDDLVEAAARATSAEVDRRQQQVSVGDVGLMLYTSGTTAAPKGAMLSHEGLVRGARLIAQTRYLLTDDDVVWTALPLFHIGGLGYVIMCIAAGVPLVHPGYFDPDVAVRQLADERVTVALPAFEMMWLAVLDHPHFADLDTSRVRLVMMVGIEERLRMLQDRFPQAPLVSTFGGTESTSHLTLSRPDDPLESRVSTGGHPFPGMQVRIVDPDTGQDCPPDVPGEIVYRGWSRFLGYYNEPDLNAEVIDADGWFYSGDVGTLDADGRLTFVGRIKDMLKVGGENVAAAEIEGLLITHPAVRFAQVVSAPDARYTEVAAAFVEPEPGAEVDEAELIEFCRGTIATFKVPRYVRFVDEWPMSGTKIKKYVLREQIATELADAGIAEAPRITST